MREGPRQEVKERPPVVRRFVARLILGLTCFATAAVPTRGMDEPAARPPAAPAGGPVDSEGAGPLAPSTAPGRRRPRDARLASDNWTFRPTVLIRRGSSQGSGTIIASVEGETLVTTAAHVVRGAGPITVELHRYNLGLENQPKGPGRWPRQVNAELVGSDPSADVAVLRIRKMVALPYTARLQPEREEPGPEAALISVGIDLGSKLSSWDTNLVELLYFELNDSGSDRPFLITSRIPEHGRSGGGLYDKEGRLVAVCVGHAELVKGRRLGIFSSVENVRQLLNAHELTAVVARSEARRDRLARGTSRSLLTQPSRPSITRTDANRDRNPDRR